MIRRIKWGNVVKMFEWMKRGKMKEENNKMNEWDTNESVEWWNDKSMQGCVHEMKKTME